VGFSAFEHTALSQSAYPYPNSYFRSTIMKPLFWCQSRAGWLVLVGRSSASRRQEVATCLSGTFLLFSKEGYL